jgi:hypothetical protein
VKHFDFLPTREQIRQNRWFGWIGPRLHHFRGFGAGHAMAWPWELRLACSSDCSFRWLRFRFPPAQPRPNARSHRSLAEVRLNSGSAWTLALEPAGHAGFSFQPGQFCWLTLRHSPFAMKEHPFSMSSAPHEPSCAPALSSPVAAAHRSQAAKDLRPRPYEVNEDPAVLHQIELVVS